MTIAVTGSLIPTVIRPGVLVVNGDIIGDEQDFLSVATGQKVLLGEVIGITKDKYLHAPREGMIYDNLREPVIFSTEEAINIIQDGSFPANKQFLTLISSNSYNLIIEDLPWNVDVGQDIVLVNLYNDLRYRTKVEEKILINGKNYLILQGNTYFSEISSNPWHLFYIEDKTVEGILVPSEYIKTENGVNLVRVRSRNSIEEIEVSIVGRRGNQTLIRGIINNTLILPWTLFNIKDGFKWRIF